MFLVSLWCDALSLEIASPISLNLAPALRRLEGSFLPARTPRFPLLIQGDSVALAARRVVRQLAICSRAVTPGAAARNLLPYPVERCRFLCGIFVPHCWCREGVKP